MNFNIRKLNICRKLFSLLLGIVLCLNMVLPAYAAEKGSCGEKLTWSIEGDVLTISGSGDMLEYSDGAFPGWYGKREEIRTIILPAGMTSISDFAFFGCNQVTSITVPSAVTEIGEYAFAQCTSLLHVDLGTGVETIGEGAFQECEALASISFPPSLTYIGSKAFYRCDEIQTVTIPVTVEKMGTSVFAYCTGLVRAEVNAPISELPDWTFYGCESLTDVSLASSIKSIGDFSFQNCENLNGVYTQGGDLNTAYDLKNSIPQEEGAPSKGVVGTFDIPETSVATTDDGKIYSEKKVVQLDDTVVSVINSTDYSNGKGPVTTTISATVNKNEDWANIAQVADETLGSGVNTPIIIEIQLIDNTVAAENLALFAGKAVTLKITTTSGTIWKLHMSVMTEKSFSGKYNLYVTVSKISALKASIDSNTVFQINFSDHIDFNADVGIKAGAANDFASLYQKRMSEYELIDTVVVDNENIGWFSLASTDKGMDYFIGINVEGITLEEAVVPDTMLEQYALDDDDATLMDKDGVKYRITGRTSKWGITSSQFMTYVFVFMAAVVLIVAIIMISFNIVKRSKEKYAELAKEDEANKQIDEEALRMEVLKELLDNSNDNFEK